MCPYVRYISQTCSIAIHVQLRSSEIANRYAEWSTTGVIYFDCISLNQTAECFVSLRLSSQTLRLDNYGNTSQQINNGTSLGGQFKKVLAFSSLNFRSLESVWGPWCTGTSKVDASSTAWGWSRLQFKITKSEPSKLAPLKSRQEQRICTDFSIKFLISQSG